MNEDRPPDVSSRPSTLQVLTTLLLILSGIDARAHEGAPVPTTIEVQPDRWVVELALDVPALMTNEIPHHNDPDAVAKRLLELSPSEREAAYARVERFVRINLRVELDGERTTPSVELPGFHPGPLGELGRARDGFRVRLSGPSGEGARTLTLEPGRALGRLQLSGFDGNGHAIGSETIQGGLDSYTIRVATQAFSQTSESEDLARTHHDQALVFEAIRKGAAHIFLWGADHFLFLIALILVAPGPRLKTLELALALSAAGVAFTLGSFGILILPVLPVELTAATSLLYPASECLRGDREWPGRRAWIPAFSAAHGFALARALLRDDLPPLSPAELFLSMTSGVVLALGVLLVVAVGLRSLMASRGRLTLQSRRAMAWLLVLVGVLSVSYQLVSI